MICIYKSIHPNLYPETTANVYTMKTSQSRRANIMFVLVFFVSFFSFSSFAANFKPVRDLKATAFPAHIELKWSNYPGFEFDVYVRKAGKFVKVGSTSRNHFFYFTGPLKVQQEFQLRVLPAGAPVDHPEVVATEKKVMMQPVGDAELVDMLQLYTTRYFDEFAEPTTGMARERSNDNHGDIVTTGGTGFGIMAMVAGAERKYLTRERAYDLIQRMVTFLEKTERFHGAWAHWYDANTGKAFSFSKFDDGGDLVETAFLVQGLLTAREYFKTGNATERLLSNRITNLWESVEWNWYTRGTDSLYWHWSKNYDFKMNHRIRGFDETMITYVLAASSPTFPIRREVYEASYKISSYYLNGKSYYGHKLDLGMSMGGPLFFTHYSFLGLNPNGLTDRHTNYFDRNKAHALIHQAYAIDNPKKHVGYGANCWGFTSSDDPLVGYTSHHPGTQDENGTISPTAAVSSVVYTPEASLAAMKHFYYDRGQQLLGYYGLYDAFNPGLVPGQQVVKSYLAIDQGPIAVMLENYRSGLIWKLFMSNPEIHQGLKNLGFEYK